jgi:hypothetical protein
MAHFAEIGLNNIVQQVIVVHNNELLDENGVEQESKGQEFCRNLLGGTWLQTSYNGSFRKNFAGTGYTYDSIRDAFIPPKPFDSWMLDEEICQWQPPTPLPDNENMYTWNESTTVWDLIE